MFYDVLFGGYGTKAEVSMPSTETEPRVEDRSQGFVSKLRLCFDLSVCLSFYQELPKNMATSAVA